MSAASARHQVHLLVEPGASLSPAARMFKAGSIVAIVLSIACALARTLPDVAPSWHPALWAAELAFTAFFAVEYAARLWGAPEHPIYSRHSPGEARLNAAVSPLMILDALGILPGLVLLADPGAGDAVLILQVVRFMRLGRYSPGLASVGRVLRAEWRALAASAMIGLGMLLLSATAMYLVERAAQPDKFASVPAAMYWAIVTLATVGYGDIVPVTPVGRILTGAVILCGLVFFALPVAIIATGFLSEIRRRDFIVTYGMVARVPLFAELDGAALAELVGMLKSRRIPRDVEVVRKGDAGDSMFFIAAGEVEVVRPGGGVRLAQGDFFGEMAVLGRTVRSATVIARRNCELLVLDAADVMKFTEQHPRLAVSLRQAAEQRRLTQEPP